VKYWLLKSEPSTYGYDRLAREKRTTWDGVRNFEARNNLRAMAVGDLCFFYHSGDDKAVVGVAKVVREAYQDPTTTEDWSVVDVAAVTPLATAVTLADIKAKWPDMVVAKKPRLSVSAVTAEQFRAVLAAGKTKLPSPP
jgi:predicted RNA-binding protein with PUA-like domain